MFCFVIAVIATVSYFTISKNPVEKCRKGVAYLKKDDRNVIDRVLNSG